MAPDDQKKDQTAEGRGQRLRVDAGKVDVARLRLAAIDRRVFDTSAKHAVDAHDRLIRKAAAGLFGHG